MPTVRVHVPDQPSLNLGQEIPIWEPPTHQSQRNEHRVRSFAYHIPFAIIAIGDVAVYCTGSLARFLSELEADVFDAAVGIAKAVIGGYALLEFAHDATASRGWDWT